MLISTSSVVAAVSGLPGGVLRTVDRSRALSSIFSAMTFISTVRLLAAAMTNVAKVVE